MSKLISYAKLENTLQKLGAQLGAAETHGMLAGMFTTNKLSKEDSWASMLLENLDCATPSKAQWDVISAAGTQILEEFKGGTFNFNVLLPKDNAPLTSRLDALVFWCRGYLTGLGLAGVTQADLSNDIVKELVQDLSHIAHVSIATDASEDDEHNYMELVEFVRVAVQNIQVELQTDAGDKILH